VLPHMLPAEIGREGIPAKSHERVTPLPSAVPRPLPPAGIRKPVELLIGTPLADVERELIEATIAHCDGSIPRAAKILALSPSTIYRKLESWTGTQRRAGT
jgi:two-component system repressor protein LuxO